MSALVLKIILVVTMTFDHVAVVFLERGSSLYEWFRIIGRPALPIACFFLAEGFARTSNRKKYVRRILLTALVAELFWFFLWSQQRIEAMNTISDAYEAAGGDAVYGADNGINEWYNKLPAADQSAYTNWIVPVLNVLFTFAICMLMLAVVNKIRDRFGELDPKHFLRNLAFLGSMAATVIITIIVCILFPLELDYAVEAPMIVLVCYMFREERRTMGVMLLVISLFMATQSMYYALSMLFGVVLIYSYNGQLGYDKEKHPLLRTLFYAYYPVHLGILVEVAYFHVIYGNLFGK